MLTYQIVCCIILNVEYFYYISDKIYTLSHQIHMRR